MEDVLTEVPPPSRFFQDDLNNFASPSPPLPTPFLLFSEPFMNKPLTPSVLIVALSAPSVHIFHQVSSKTLIGSVIIPEIPLSGSSIKPSLKDKSCNIYSLNDAEKMVLLVSVQCPVPAERAYAVSKLLLGGQITPERVLILDSIKVQNFRGKLARDETLAYKLVTPLERKDSGDGNSSLLKDLDCFPSGSVVDGLSAALLGRCQIKKIKATLCVSWPNFGYSVLSLIRSLLVRDVFPRLEIGASGNFVDETLKADWINDPLLDTELYT